MNRDPHLSLLLPSHFLLVTDPERKDEEAQTIQSVKFRVQGYRTGLRRLRMDLEGQMENNHIAPYRVLGVYGRRVYDKVYIYF